MSATNRAVAQPAERVLQIARVFDAPRALVFKAWTDPVHLVRWWGPKDFTLPSCEMAFRPGGAYRFCMRSPEGTDHWVWGEYREIVPPERLVFTWVREEAPGQRHETLVTVSFADLGQQTRLTLHQAVFESVAARDAHNGGWTECLDRLGAYVLKL